MRFACLVGTPPKKLGSVEQWIVGMAAEARRRGHELDLFTLQPVHPNVAAELKSIGTRTASVEDLAESRLDAVRRLASYDVLHVNMLQPRSTTALLCYAAWPAKVIFVDHCSGGALPDAIPMKRELSRALDQVTFARVDELVGVSEYVRARDAGRFNLNADHTRVIYNGVDLARFSVEKSRAEGRELRLLCVAQLIPEKGIDVLLRALTRARTKNLSLTIAGYGRMEAEYRALAERLHLDHRVRFLGMRDDVQELLRDADVMVHPAIWEEAFGLTVIEGMAAGCAVIASHSGGIPEIIQDGVDGLLVPRGDEAALAKAIDNLAVDRALRESLARSAREKVALKFTLSRWIHDHVNCMEEIAFDQKNRARRPRPAPATARPAAPSLFVQLGGGRA
ncbi:MAG: glycosyltransferase family 4 protein [Myxococcaceae bacterium]